MGVGIDEGAADQEFVRQFLVVDGAAEETLQGDDPVLADSLPLPGCFGQWRPRRPVRGLLVAEPVLRGADQILADIGHQ